MLNYRYELGLLNNILYFKSAISEQYGADVHEQIISTLKMDIYELILAQRPAPRIPLLFQHMTRHLRQKPTQHICNGFV